MRAMTINQKTNSQRLGADKMSTENFPPQGEQERAGCLSSTSSLIFSSSPSSTRSLSSPSSSTNYDDSSSLSIPFLFSSTLSSFIESNLEGAPQAPPARKSQNRIGMFQINTTCVSVLLFSLILSSLLMTPVTSQRAREDDKPDGTSLAFVFDITGSMYDDLVQVIKGAKEILDVALKRREKPLFNYVLVPFHDPIIGPVVVTTDHIEFQEELKNIYVQGGGDCPEMSVGAIKTALEVSLPHSFIYVFTDARSKDYYLKEEVLSLIQQKQSQVVFVLTGDCGNVTHSGYRAYEEIAATSSGQVFLLPKSQVKHVLDFVKVAIQARKVNLLSINEDEGRTQVFNIPLDSHLKEVTVSVSGESPRIYLRDPEGNRKTLGNGLKELLNLKNILIYSVKDPEPGTWRFRVSSSGAHTIRVTGLSPADFASGFSKYPTKDMAQTQLRPIMGIPTNVLLNTTGMDLPNNLNDLELVDLRGNSLMKFPLDRDPAMPSLYNTTSFIPPQQYFYVKVTGVDDQGYVLQRTTPTAISPLKPRAPRVVMPEVTRGFYDQTSTITCQVFSLVPYTVQWYYKKQPQGLEQFYSDPANVTLEIPRSTSYVEGEYACNATNKAGSKVAVTYLDVSDPPPVIMSAENVSALPGDTAVLSCPAFSTVAYNMTWKRNDKYGALTLDPRIKAYDNNSLVIRNVDRNDEGTYRCIASNEGGSISASLHLKLEFPPVAQIAPTRQTYVTGSSRNFTCIAGGYPTPTFSWSKDGSPVVTTGRIQVDGGYISFRNLGQSDGGVYECMATNTAGLGTAAGKLIYTEAPFIRDYDKKVLVAVGDEARLKCKADGTPAPNVTWYLSDRQLLSAYGVDINQEGTMTISLVQDSDAGVYRCVVTNEAGQHSVEVQLEVGSPPIIVLAPDGIGIEIEGNGSLPCQARGYPSPKILWRRADGKPLDLGGTFQQRPSGTLDINMIGLEDEGLYTCEAHNPFGVREASASVSVTGIVPPLIIHTQPYVRVMHGETTELECIVLLGKPKPKLTWTRNGAPVTESPRRYFEDPSRLIILDVQEEDEGGYVCMATNIGGSDTYTIMVDVLLAPRFIILDDADSQTNFTVVQGLSVFLPCTVSSDPPATYTWFKDGSPISLTDIRYFVRSDGALEIFSADIEDSASYVCVASNVAGEVDKTINLFVEVIPIIEGDSEETFEININESIILPCDVFGTPKPTVSWTKNFVNLISDSSRVQVVEGGLSISKAEIGDKAIYKCMASNIAGVAEKIVTLLVFIPPSLEDGPTDVTVLLGQTATLKCEAQGDPLPTILWRRDGVIIDTKDPNSGYYTSGMGSLTIQEVSIKDAGRYSCSATNPAGVVTRELQLTVHGVPEIPGNYKMLHKIIENNPVILPCPAEGSPAPLVSWTKDGELLDFSQLPFGVAQLSDGSLEILQTKAEDAGDYKCVAVNVAGIASRDFKLKVLVPPRMIGIDINITPGERPQVIQAKNVTLKCPVSPDAEPRPVITWFRDNQKLSPGGRFVISPDGGQLAILGVDVLDEARYKCEAVNVAGRVEYFFDLDVQVPPTLEDSNSSPENQTVVKDRQLYINCPITGKPPPQVTWLKDGEPLSANLDNNVRLHAGGRRLEIVSAKVTDKGRYVCIGQNIAGNTTKGFNVIVHVPPSMENSGAPHKKEEVEGNTIELRCPAYGVPRPTITWFKQEVPIKTNTSRVTLLDKNWTLQIRDVDVTDAARYYCKAENVAGESEKAFDIEILVRAIIDRKDLDPEPDVIVNTTAIMNCHVKGNPLPEIVWHRNGNLLDPSVHQRYEILAGGRQLRIYPAQVQDRGRYTCIARNRAGVDEINFDLNIMVPPRIDRQNIQHQSKALLNSTVTISCLVSGTPQPIISWLKDNQPIVYQQGRVETRGDGSELVLTGVQLSDTAQYKCVAENDAGEDSLNFQLEVHVRPSIPTEDIIINPKVVENDTAVLVCPATGTPPPSIMWFMNGFPLELEVLRHITLDEDGTRLIISPVKASDAGTYVCIAANEAGETEQKYKLEVWIPPVIDRDNIDPNPKVIKGHTAIIDCPVSGIPLPKIVWLKAGQPVRYDARVQRLDGGRKLEIQETNEQDSALYTCEVSNEAGNNKANYNLLVLVPPSIDESNVVYNRKVNTGRDVVLECPVAGIPPPSIEWFIKGTPVQTNDPRLRDNMRILEINNIQVEDSGFYTCLASNDAGQLERNFNVAVLIPPSIDRKGLQTVLDVIQNKSILIHCPASGEPEPDIVWARNGYRLELPYQSYRLLDDSKTLEISNAQLRHAANYTCTASNDAGWDEVKFTLDVFVPPAIGKPTPDKLHVVMEQAISMRCTVTGTPEPSILWLKDGDVILEVDEESRIQILDKGQILQITNSQSGDQARYTCHAENQAGFMEKYFDLEVWEPARINGSGRRVEVPVILNRQVVLECPAEGSPAPEITWLRKNSPIPSYGMPNIRIQDNGKQLVIMSAQLLDFGEYSCKARNPAGEDRLQFRVSIVVPPEIEEGPEEVAAVINTRALLLCESSSQPMPDVSWTKDGEPFPATGLRHRMLPSGSLEFMIVRLEDQGTFTCTASNDAGQETRTIQLYVQIPARIKTQGRETLKVAKGKSVTLVCDAEGTPPPTLLWLKYRQYVETDQRISVLENGSLHIKDLRPSDAGIYTCLAQNNAGTASKDIRVWVQEPPVISVEQKVFTVLQNRTIVLPCRASGRPQPKIRWRKDGQDITSTYSNFRLSFGRVHYITLQTGGLAIPHTRAQDAGSYVCVAENKAGSTTNELTLVVQVPPMITAVKRQYVASVGDSMSLPCQTRGSPTPRISWTKDRRRLDFRNSKFNVLSNGTLIINTIEAGDAGNYICTAENTVGKDSQSRLLRVQVPPKFVTVPRDKELTVNSRFQLRCIARGIPTPSITWMLNGKPLAAPPSLNGVSILRVRNAMKEDAGEYTCVATNPANDQQVTATARVLVKVPPRVIVPPGDRAVRIADKVVLDCNVRGDPAPKILWTKDGRPVVLNDRIQQLSNGSLVIYDLGLSDAGNYKCIAINDAGTTEAQSIITVKTEPKFKIEPTNAMVEIGQTVIYDCVAEGVPPPQMSWWKGTQQISSQGRITVMVNNSLRIVAVQQEDVGLYRCLAANSLGKTLVEAVLDVVVHGQYSSWGEWGACSLTCGRGQRSRERTCDNPTPDNGGRDCQGPAVEHSSCLLQLCPVDGQWSTWQEWDSCSTSCGTGQRSRRRFCNNPAPQMGGKPCYGQKEQTTNCKVTSCKVDGQWGGWSSWSVCSKTCGEGRQERYRSCDAPQPQHGGRECVGEATDSQNCQNSRCAVDGNWSSWTVWSSCSLSCGGGVQFRRRSCDNPPPQNRGSYCRGTDMQQDYCNNEPCPVHGNWGTWSAWGKCSLSCGGGLKKRFRTCNNPTPSGSGRACAGSGEESDSCNNHRCPVDGRFGEWSSWSECSVTCGQGSRERFRQCSQPVNGGRRCRGDNSQIIQCHLKPCYVLPREAQGNLIGYINSIDIPEATIIASMTPNELTGTSKIEAVVRNVPPAAANHLQHLVSLLTPVYWTTAYEVDGARNGYSLTGGEFLREVQVEFPTGEILKMSHYANGMDRHGNLQFDIIIRGEVPELGDLTNVHLAPYQEEYIQTGPGTIYAHSSRMFSADGITMPYAWNHTIDYNETIGPMPFLVQVLHAKDLTVDVLPGHESIQFVVEASIAPGIPSNRCPPGFTHNLQYSFCQDDNECSRLNPCSHTCHNTPGSYSCSCPAGFSLKADAKTCQDIDECATGIANCLSNQDCLNRPGSFRCVSKCQPGFERDETGDRCIDTNECEANPQLCEQTCQNLVGSYRCSCLPGFRLEKNGKCSDVNECELSSTRCSHGCVNTRGSYRCSCPAGYRMVDGKMCRDVNECNEKKGVCPRNQECVNTEGSYRCVGVCPPGFERTWDGQCQDVNECETGTHQCRDDQGCVNLRGSYQCTCPRGFITRGPGQPCVDIDECRVRPSPCSYRCLNTRGDYQCLCPPGQLRLADRKSCAGLEFLAPQTVSRVFDDGSDQFHRHRDRDPPSIGRTRQAHQSLWNSNKQYVPHRHGSPKYLHRQPSFYSNQHDGKHLNYGNRRKYEKSHHSSPQVSSTPTLSPQFLHSALDASKQDGNNFHLQARFRTFSSRSKQGRHSSRRRRDTSPLSRIYLSVGKADGGVKVPIRNNLYKLFITGIQRTRNLGYRNEIDIDSKQSALFNNGVAFGNEHQTSEMKKQQQVNMNVVGKDQSIPIVLHMESLPFLNTNQSVSMSSHRVIEENGSGLPDVNECHPGGRPGGRHRSVCQHKCHNIKGGYRCSCPAGYRLGPDGYSCQDIDECREQKINCGTEKMCFNQRGGHSCIDIPCPPDYARDPTTKFCVLECVNPKIPCPPGAKYADIIEFRTISLPGGYPSRQDLIRLTAYNQNDHFLPQTVFSILKNDVQLDFHLKTEGGRGIVFTLEPLQDGATYQITVRAKSYDDSYRRNIQYQTTFIIHISVASYPY